MDVPQRRGVNVLRLELTAEDGAQPHKAQRELPNPGIRGRLDSVVAEELSFKLRRHSTEIVQSYGD